MIRIAFAGLVACGCLTVGLAEAGEPPEAEVEVQTLFGEGVASYTAGDVGRALAQFRRAYQLSGRASILYNIAQASYELDDPAGALSAFEKYLATGGTAIAPERRSEVEREIRALGARVGRIDVACNVRDARVSIDGVEVGGANLSHVVNPGVRRVRVTRVDFVPAEIVVTIAAQEQSRPQVTLTRAVGTPIVERAQGPQKRGPWLYVVAPAAFGLLGTTFGMVALADKSNLDGVCHQKICPPEQQFAVRSLRRNATVSTVAFGAAALSAAVGAILWFRHSDERARVAVGAANGSATIELSYAFH